MLDLFESEQIAGRTTMSPDNKVLTFVPSISLDSWYGLEISDARDGAGNTMAPYNWEFSNSGWSSKRSAQSTPTVGRLWTRPFTGASGHTVTSTTTPDFLIKVSDPLRRRSAVTVEIEHDPKAHSQGTGLIWSGNSAPAVSGGTATVRIPSGKLVDGWQVRWRARAAVGDMTGAWSDWQSMTVRLPQPTAKPSPEAAPAAAPKTFPYNRVTWDDCTTNPLSTGPRPRPNGISQIGYAFNAYNWCAAYGMTHYYFRVWYNKKGDVVRRQYKAHITFRLAMRAYTHAGGKKGSSAAEYDKGSGVYGRDTLFKWRIDQIKLYGDREPYFKSKLYLGVTVSDRCQIEYGPKQSDHTGLKDDYFGNWELHPEEEWTIRSPKNLGEGKHLLSNCMIVPISGFTAPGSWPPAGDYSKELPVESPIIRCDTSDLIEMYTGGCVFLSATPVLVFDAVPDSRIRDSAKHVWDAYYNADKWTRPVISPETKKVPGRAPNGKLHRTVEGAVPGLEDPDEAPSGTIKSNRDYSVGICRQQWPSVNPEADDLDCDEFPFASTMEGSKSANGHFSVRYISHKDNRRSGKQLGVFYQRQRRLAVDPFWVYTNPLPGDRDAKPPRY